LLATRPAFAVEKAVRGMLPKNRLGRAMIKKLHVVPGPEHRHQAQKPVDWTMGARPAWEGLPVRVTPPVDGEKKRSTKTTKRSDVDAPATRQATRKTTAKKPTATKTTARQTTTRKPAAAKKPTARKTTTKKTAARKPAATTKKKGT
jgi:hypothetical protein